MKTIHGIAVLLLTLVAACGDNTSAAANSAPAADAAEPPAATVAPITTAKAFEMSVSDVFTIAGKGLVATGQVKRGAVAVGDEVCTASGKRTTVEGIEMFRKTLETLNAGDMGGLLLKGLSKADVNKGDLITRC